MQGTGKSRRASQPVRDVHTLGSLWAPVSLAFHWQGVTTPPTSLSLETANLQVSPLVWGYYHFIINGQ